VALVATISEGPRCQHAMLCADVVRRNFRKLLEPALELCSCDCNLLPPARTPGARPPGRFRMGSPPDEPERRSDEAQVDVTLTKGFWLGKYEATQGQWKRVVGKRYACMRAQGDQQLTCLSVGR
jgi:Sulfatase-modifying factor enzyme 1